MANTRRANDDEAWMNAKKICRLNARQVEMARALGMNPRKLPSLRPSPQQRWKLPVGEFIEERYWKKFGDHPRDHHPHGPEPGSRKLSTPDRDADVSERVRDPAWQLSDLVCYLMNLADDLQKIARTRVDRPGGAATGTRGVGGDRGRARHASADLTNSGDSATAMPGEPFLLTARPSGPHIRR